MKTLTHSLIIQVLSIIGITISCNSVVPHKGANNQTITNELKSVENFDKFYDRFHSDSSFQITRIKIPLKGLRFDGEKEIKWSKDTLPFLSTKIYDVDTTEYKVSFKKTETEFKEKVWIENSGFWCEYKFELIDNKWYLVSAVEHDL